MCDMTGLSPVQKGMRLNPRTDAWLSAQGNRFSMGLPSISEGVRLHLLHIYSSRPAVKGREFYVNERTGAWLTNQRHAGQSPSAVLSKHLLPIYFTQCVSKPHRTGGTLR